MLHFTHVLRGQGRRVYVVQADGTIKTTDPAYIEDIAAGKSWNECDAAAIKEAADILADIKREDDRQKEQDDARERCKAYAEELDAVANGDAYICPVCGEIITADELDESEHEDEDGATLCTCPHCGEEFAADEVEKASIYDYFNKNDIYNIEYRVDAQNDLRSVEIMIACGGPNIYIDTAKNAILLYWWGTSAEYPIDSDTADALEEYARELRGEY